MLTKEDKKLIRNRLPYGYGAKIAAKANVSAVSVCNWFAGKLNSEKIEDAVFDTLSELKTKQEKRIRLLKSL